MKTSYYITIIAFLFISSLGAQTTINGTVKDEESGELLIGATVRVLGTTVGTSTDIDGNFQLNVPEGKDSLQVSYIGYETLKIALNGQTSIQILLGLEGNELDEVVVVGYGRQKKKVLTGAIAQVSKKEIQATPISRVEQSLQGRTPGVQVTQLSGQPGDEPTVRVRGTGTTGNAKPLYIVDGMPVSGIDYLNPGDIASIDVLKDAASSAIYGARAANGVVLITTNSGSEGRMQISYDGYYALQNVAKTLDMLNADEYKMMMNEGARNAGLTEPFNELEISEFDTDWQDEIFTDNAPMINHQLTVSGGNAKSSFASSFSYFAQEGIIGAERSQFDRYTARINSRHQVNKVFSFGNNLAYTHLIKRGIGTNESFNGVYSSALNLDPLTPVVETREEKLSAYPYDTEPVILNGQGQPFGISEYVGAEVVNPVALLEIQNNETRKDQIVGNVFGELEFIPNLKLRSSFGIDYAYLLNDNFRPLYFLNGAQLNDNKTSVTKSIERYYTWQWENTLSYQVDLGDHDLSGLAGITSLEFNFEDLSGFNAGVPVNDPDNVYLDLATDTVWTANGGALHSSLYSVFGRINYSYKDKYSLTGIVRRDGSSKFGPNNRFGIFPSVGVAWVLSDESFMLDQRAFTYLKLRASWGINGNQEIGDYQFVSSLVRDRGYTFGGGRAIGSSPEFIENPDIAWEESEQLNFGLDAGMLNNRLQFSLDYYIKQTNGLLERIAIPGHVGNDGPIANVGSIENRGVELGINWRETKGKLSYFISLNGAYNENEVTNIANTEKVIPGATWAIAGTVTRATEGDPVAYFWGYKTDGIFQTQEEVFSHINNQGELLQARAKPGDVRFVDVNGDGIINDEDRTILGNPTPDFTMGFTGNVQYGQFDLSVFLQGAFGHQIFNGTQRQDLRYTNRTNDILDRWTGAGTSNEIPRFTWLDVNNNYRISDLYIENGDYLRLKNIQLGYALPESITNRIGAQNFRIYVSGENLFTITEYSGVDPEIGAQSSFDIGIDRGIYPLAKIYRFGLNVTF
jgi:TonB-linked SusC/RagA family outer membrane protein